MSLFLGNLSDHIQQEDLEHVFRRFGRCSVRMKDGYGFVVFEVHVNAEKALRTLRGKLICGEQINISWSNKQPRNFQKFPRNRFYEPYGGRNPREGEFNLNHNEHDRRDFGRRQSSNRRAFHISNPHDRGLAHKQHTDLVDDVGRQPLEKGGASNEFNTAEDGRLGEPDNNAIDNVGIGNGTDFERYEPNRDYDANDVDGNGTSGSRGSPSHRRSGEKGEDQSDTHLKHLDNLRQQPVCYNCGLLGHIVRTCPRGKSSRFDKPNRFHNRRVPDEDYGGRSEGESSRRNYQARRETSRDVLFSGQDLRVATEFQHKNRKRMLKGRGKFTVLEDNFCDKRTEMDHLSKKRGRLEKRSKEKQLNKRKKRHSTSLDSDSNGTSFVSHSISSKSGTKSTSQSSKRSASLRPSNSHSHSSESRSASVSTYSRSKHRRLRLRSRSRSRSRSKSVMSNPQSLSISLGRKTVSIEENVKAYDSGTPSIIGRQKDASIPKPDNIKENIYSPVQGDDLDAEMVDISSEPVDAIGEENPVDGLDGVDISKAYGPHQNLGLSSSKRNTCDDAIAGSERPNMEFLGTPDSRRVSFQEIFSVSKHYGLEVTEKCEPGLTVGTFFGAARFWPWELIYYRRLKKGPISTENYARRVQQNKEFGIIDKYIRSSSGWGECTENDA